MKIWSVTYHDPNKGIPMKELYIAEIKLVTEQKLLRDIKAGLVAEARYMGKIEQ